MLGKTGSFVGFAGGSVGVIHTGGNFGDLHIFRAEFFQHKLIHHLADTFQAGVGFGGIVANFADKTIMFVSDKSDDFAIVFAYIYIVKTAVDLIFYLQAFAFVITLPPLTLLSPSLKDPCDYLDPPGKSRIITPALPPQMLNLITSAKFLLS